MKNPVCVCNHRWENHHRGCVMNPLYFEHPLTIDGLMAQECEEHQTNGEYSVPYDEACHCPSFKPKSKRIKDQVKQWEQRNKRSLK